MQTEFRALKSPKLRITLLLLILTAGSFIAVILGHTSTHLGVGVSPDSVRYLDAARSLLSGNGLVSMGVPLTHYPPMYPIMLGLAAKTTGADPLTTARWFHVALFGLNACLVGVIGYRTTNGSLFVTVISMLLFLSSGTTLVVHTMAWSESLFIFLALLSSLILIQYVAAQRSYLLIIISVLLALASVTRYIGITLVLPAIIVVILYVRKPIKERLIGVLTLLLVPLLALLLWFGRNVAMSRTAMDRSLVYHPVTLLHVKQIAYTVSIWIWPFDSPLLIRICFALVLSLLFLLVLSSSFRHILSKADYPPLRESFFVFSVVFSVSYLSFLLITVSLLDAATPFDFRMLSPLYTFGLILFSAWLVDALSLLSRSSKSPGVTLSALLFSCWLVLCCGQTAWAASELHSWGQGYNSRDWESSELISFLSTDAVPNNRLIYTNGPELVYFLTQREAQRLPWRVHPSTLLPNRAFQLEVNQLRENVIRQDGLVVIFRNFVSEPYLAEIGDLQLSLPFSLLVSEQSGAIYGVDHNQ